MEQKKSISALVSGGEASAGPPLGPALGPMGINVLQVVNTINEKTKEFHGMKVPVKVEVDPDTKKFNVEVGVPPTTALIAKEANISKGSGTAGKDFVGNISMEAIVKTGFKDYVAQEFMPTGKTNNEKIAALKDAVRRCDV